MTTVGLTAYLHDVEEVIVDLGLAPELELDLVQVGESVLHLQSLERWRLGGPGRCETSDIVGRHRPHGLLLAPEGHGPVSHLLDDVGLVQLHVDCRAGHGHCDGGGGGHDGLGREGGVLDTDWGLRQADGLRLDVSRGRGELLVDDGGGLGTVSRGGGWGWSRGDGGALSVHHSAHSSAGGQRSSRQLVRGQACNHPGGETKARTLDLTK